MKQAPVRTSGSIDRRDKTEAGMAYESREQFADAGSDVGGLDAVEGREVEVGDEEGVVGGGHGRGGGGAGGEGRRRRRPGAEGTEWGGGREAGEEEEAGGSGRVWEAGGDGEWEASGGEEGGGKEKHGGGGGGEDSDVLTWAWPRVGHHCLGFFPSLYNPIPADGPLSSSIHSHLSFSFSSLILKKEKKKERSVHMHTLGVWLHHFANSHRSVWNLDFLNKHFK